ncbi:MAG TPA: shikimate dehydrogenase [Ktedonobacteraceae bacterium]|nr:shikimate dehydrogenase [Ktedonobacteraceae bacterium]
MKQVGLVGFPVAHSRSPQMQNAGFRTLGIDAHYALWETPPESLEKRIASLRSPEFLGANVTIPYKEQVVALLDECDLQARRIGAVNTIVHRYGRLIGYNTDAPGLLRALAECPGYPFHSAGKKVVILGTGGAARGAAVALLDAGAASITFLGRSVANVQALRQHILALSSGTVVQGAIFHSIEADTFLREADLVVNATSVGLKSGDDTILFDVSLLPADALVMDMIFNVERTALLQAALERGCRILNGLPMLLYQGTLAFELWTGRDAPVAVMREALGLQSRIR